MAGCSVGQIVNSRRLLNSCSKFSLIKKRLLISCLCSSERDERRSMNCINGKYYKYGGINGHCCLLFHKENNIMPSRTFFQVPGMTKSNKRQEYSTRKLIGFSMENLYHVVSHVEDYKHFVPWCRDSVVFDQNTDHVKCKLVIGFPPLVERYISVLTLVPPNLVVSECTQGELFNYMKTVWRFSPGLKGNPRTTIVDFQVAFEFRSALHSNLSSVFFDEVVRRMVGAFEKRCEQLYGPSSLTGSRQKQRLKRKARDRIGTSNR